MIKRYAHFGLAFLSMAFGTPVMLYLSPNPFSLIALTLLVTTLAFWYEWKQAMNKKEVQKHGGLEAFRKDSKKDIAQALFAIPVGVFIGIIIYVIL